MPARTILRTVIFFLLATSSLNAQTKGRRIPSPDDALPDKIETLKQQISNLTSQLASLKADFDLYKSSQEFEKTLSKRDSVMLDPSNPQVYSRIDTDNGWFLISLQAVESYLDGYKLTINIGNPSSATYDGFKVTTKWSSSYDWAHYTEDSLKSWQSAIKSKKDDLTDTLQPGAWNSVQIILPSTKSTELGYIQLSIATNNVSLRTN